MPSSLEQAQAQFASVLMDAAAAWPESLLEREPRARERMALYRANIVASWRGALAAAYPVVHALVGAEFFAELARAYGMRHPSTSGDLNVFGAHFAEFAEAFPHTQALPYLADVAALEWAVHRARHAADAEPLRRELIATLRPDELLAACFELHPACTWLVSRHPIASLWLAHQADADVELPASLQCPEFALVARPRWRVEVVATSAGELVALDALRSGLSMDATIALALRTDHRFDFAKAFMRWLELGLFTACSAI